MCQDRYNHHKTSLGGNSSEKRKTAKFNICSKCTMSWNVLKFKFVPTLKCVVHAECKDNSTYIYCKDTAINIMSYKLDTGYWLCYDTDFQLECSGMLKHWYNNTFNPLNIIPTSHMGSNANKFCHAHTLYRLCFCNKMLWKF